MEATKNKNKDDNCLAIPVLFLEISSSKVAGQANEQTGYSRRSGI